MLLRALDVRSKVILTLFLVSGVAVLVTAVIGYRSGREALTERIGAQLTSLAATTGQQVEAYIEAQEGHVAALSADLMVTSAAQDFAGALAAMRTDSDGAPDVRLGLIARYQSGYLARLPGTDGAERVTEAYLPRTPAGLRLQHAYVLREDGQGGSLSAPAPYARAHDRYHAALSALVAEGEFEDVFLVSPDGLVLYSVLKEPDFATSLTGGPYADTGLGRAFRAARDERARGRVHVEDYDFYEPSLGVPAAFLAVPLYEGGQLVGVLAAQLSDARLDAIVNMGGRWRAAGLGEGGEVLLVGADTLLRTVPRAYLESPDAFMAAARGMGAEAPRLTRIAANDSPVLLQSASSDAVTEAIRGRTGVRVIGADYAGLAALSAHAPLDLPGLDWVVIAEMPLAEAYEPIRTFERRLVIAGAGLSVGLTALAMLLAAGFLAPIRTLTARVRQVAGGDLDTQVALDRRDEFGELSAEVQALVNTLKERQDTSQRALRRAEGVLARFLPEGAVRVLERQIEDDARGDDAYELSEEIPALSVVVLHLHGHEAALEALPPGEAVALLDRLVGEIAGLTERHGVEEVRFTSDRYVAASGLSSPHLDHERRAVAFARDALAAVARLAKAEGLAIEASAGVASGADVMGVLGAHRLSFGLWGTTAAEAKAQAGTAGPGEVAMTAGVRAALGEAHSEAGTAPRAAE